ncbi:MAG: IS66 family transposase [Candidatus Aminicenantes bacterium]|nr:IS66 family transposase [Candidatus Aminicenantes bacterium]
MQLGAWRSSDEEKRLLRLRVSSLGKALESQRKARQKLEQENKNLVKDLEEAQKTIKQLEGEKDKLQRQSDRYRSMIFKQKTKRAAEEDKKAVVFKSLLKEKRKRGGQKGHKGYGRKKPEQVDEVLRIYLTRCPHCTTEIARSHTVENHIVEDIPQLEEVRSRVVCYETEVQWCRHCRKVIRGKAVGIIPGSRLGLNTLLYVLLQKYVSRSSWEIIEKNLKIFYGLKVSRGALVDMMHRVRKWLGPKYQELLEAIQSSPVKYADETSWRVENIAYWLWGFFTEQHAFYTVEESRGKGVPWKVLSSSHPQDVLVRDDYGGYTKLPLMHQSCWAHLLRNSHEESVYPNASSEVIKLHEKLKSMFDEISEILKKPFDLEKRQKEHERFLQMIMKIIGSKYQHEDVKKIQTRISNQKANLLTALIKENVPLTNNLAERAIRPLVVIRKISGGSKSQNGASTLAVIMSILQTLNLQNKPLIPSLKESILNSL